MATSRKYVQIVSFERLELAAIPEELKSESNLKGYIKELSGVWPKILTLKNKKIDDAGIAMLAPAISDKLKAASARPHPVHITKIDLSQNQIGAEGARLLSDNILIPSKINYIDLSANKIDFIAAMRLIEKACLLGQALTINFDHNLISQLQLNRLKVIAAESQVTISYDSLVVKAEIEKLPTFSPMGSPPFGSPSGSLLLSGDSFHGSEMFDSSGLPFAMPGSSLPMNFSTSVESKTLGGDEYTARSAPLVSEIAAVVSPPVESLDGKGTPSEKKKMLIGDTRAAEIKAMLSVERKNDEFKKDITSASVLKRSQSVFFSDTKQNDAKASARRASLTLFAKNAEVPEGFRIVRAVEPDSPKFQSVSGTGLAKLNTSGNDRIDDDWVVDIDSPNFRM